MFVAVVTLLPRCADNIPPMPDWRIPAAERHWMRARYLKGRGALEECFSWTISGRCEGTTLFFERP